MQDINKVLKLKKFKELPKSISSHPIYKKYKNIDKKFDDFGLKDFSIKLSNIKNIIPSDLKDLKDKDLIKLYKDTLKPNWKIVFSTKAQDILTMSMRGIKSCQRWKSKHSSHLLGSLLDPLS